VTGGQFVREARRRAGLSQRALARKAGTTQSALARLESGLESSSFERIVSLVRACGFDLDIRLVPLDEDQLTLAEQLVEVSPDERLDALLRGLELLEAGELARSAHDG
jgi:transcriptional regulator with XRE-family HTH domain